MSVDPGDPDPAGPIQTIVIPTTVKRPRALFSAGVGRRDLVFAIGSLRAPTCASSAKLDRSVVTLSRVKILTLSAQAAYVMHANGSKFRRRDAACRV